MKKQVLVTCSLITAISLMLMGCGSQIGNSSHNNSNSVKNGEVGDVQLNTKVNDPEVEITKIAVGEANHKIYNDLSEIEDRADLIVNVNYTGDSKTHNYLGESGEIAYTNTLSTVEVKKTYKGDVQEKSVIGVYQPAFIENSTLSTVEGYNLMNQKGNYILFLKKLDNETAYSIIGMYQGKFDLSISEKVVENVTNLSSSERIQSEYMGSNVDHFNKLKEQVEKKYK
ncbi:hypothetical protein ABEW34_13515 [Paenibacillus algorifonticola]|uniref:hypothetical protein n=1 Tax=Paenibacillus algorifonticola TaxID=684063 RepID=UPI003D2C3871